MATVIYIYAYISVLIMLIYRSIVVSVNKTNAVWERLKGPKTNHLKVLKER